MKNFEIARIFAEIADLLEIKGENPFRIRTYRKASQNLEGLGRDIAEEARKETLEEIPNIGKNLAKKIEEYLESGKVQFYERLKGEIPPGLLELIAVPGVGPKTARRGWLEKGDLLNTLTLPQLIKELQFGHKTTTFPRGL